MLAVTLGCPPSTLEESIKRTRKTLLRTLEEMYWKERRRPSPLVGTDYPHIGLVMDCTTVQTYHPNLRLAAAKHYFDENIVVYGLKKLVIVSASPPHLALFTEKGEPGSVHDMTILKKTHEHYQEYLLKRPDESMQLLNLDDHPSWAILGDKDFAGDPQDTPGLRRMFMYNNPTEVEKQMNEKLSKVHEVVEQYFGRMEKLWQVVGGLFRWDRSRFDENFDLAALLTNFHIERNPLEHSDFEYHRKLIQLRREDYEQAIKRRKEQYEVEREKRRKLESEETKTPTII